MSKLLEFMIKLGEDAELRARYVKSPKTTMKDFGLTDEESVMMLDGDIGAIREALGVEHVYMNVHIPACDDDDNGTDI